MDYLGSRLQAVRKREGLNQEDACKLLEIAYGTYLNIEHGKGTSWENVQKIITNPRFEKYAVYLTTGKAYQPSEQVMPENRDDYKPAQELALKLSEDDLKKLLTLAESLPKD
ncbi:helix-turn-helix domain-containing protein [Gammaproteobacteria bacterium]|nr:helix-turn-helix domain-containing protein [Gammaproteobacteria bacterium]